jgi:hypothetical protein
MVLKSRSSVGTGPISVSLYSSATNEGGSALVTTECGSSLRKKSGIRLFSLPSTLKTYHCFLGLQVALLPSIALIALIQSLGNAVISQAIDASCTLKLQTSCCIIAFYR